MQTNWDSKNIYTLVGYYQTDNTFIDLNQEVYQVITYREYNNILKPDQLVCVNLRWVDSLKMWAIFQAVKLDENNSLSTVDDL